MKSKKTNTMNPFSLIRARFTRWIAPMALVTAVFAVGCKSMDKPASTSFASVDLHGYSIPQIKEATMAVFRQNGYKFIGQQGDHLVFNREATRGETIGYVGLVGAHYGEKVVMQGRVEIEDLPPSGYRLFCKAYSIKDAGEPVFEESTAVMDFQSGSYQKLMDKVLGTLLRSKKVP